MPVSTPHPEYSAKIHIVEKTRSAIAGLDEQNGKPFLVQKSGEEDQDFDNRLKRANYTNYSARTANGFLGAAFRQSPMIKLDSDLEHLRNDIDGKGTDINQFAQMIFSEEMEAGRYGLLAEFPETGGELTLEQKKQKNLRSYIAPYPFESILNWKTSSVNGREVLTLLVLKEHVFVNDDEFDHEKKTEYRVLRMVDGYYAQQRYDADSEAIAGSLKAPRDAAGKLFDHIPFSMIGSKNNLMDIDRPVVADIAQINIAHYRNSSDHETNLAIHSGATLVISTNMDIDQFKTANPSGITVGANSGILLGSGDKAELLQLEAASAVSEEMQIKENRMVQIGAKLITKTSGNETAEAARINASSENSILEVVINNIEEGMISALSDCAIYEGVDPESITFKMNKDFWMNKIDPQLAMSLIQFSDMGVMRKADIVTILQDAELVDKTLSAEEIIAEASQESPL
jgi:hypothetical protein